MYSLYRKFIIATRGEPLATWNFEGHDIVFYKKCIYAKKTNNWILISSPGNWFYNLLNLVNRDLATKYYRKCEEKSLARASARIYHG